MRRALTAVLLVGAFAASASYAAKGRQPTTTGSFLIYRANSAQELATMVRQDPALAMRYARHFKTTPAGVASYFDSHVRLIRLRSASSTYIYYYDYLSRVVRGRRVMPAGTLVFATDNGIPLLDWRCGNPLTTRLPAPRAIKTSETPMTKVKGTTSSVATVPGPDEVVEKVLATTPVEVPAVAVTPVVAPIVTEPIAAIATANLPPIIEAATTPAVASVGSVPAIGRLGWLAPLAALSGVTHSKKPESPVPEPASLGAFATGFGATLAVVLRRRKTKVRN